VLQPEYIVCLGMAAMKALFPQATTIGKMRGQIHPHGARKVIITYHPSYLLRHGDDSDRSKPDHPKRLVWEDMKMMLADMGLAMPEKR
jgi:DNA polymerase